LKLLQQRSGGVNPPSALVVRNPLHVRVKLVKRLEDASVAGDGIAQIANVGVTRICPGITPAA
jgi:hypothetical protein